MAWIVLLNTVWGPQSVVTERPLSSYVDMGEDPPAHMLRRPKEEANTTVRVVAPTV